MIYHIVPREAWAAAEAAGIYRGDTLDAEGFIHFSTREQVLYVADARFKAHTGLLLLAVDESKLEAELKYEPPYENAPEALGLFPHLYGALNMDAVTQVAVFEPNEEGNFSFPVEL
jgi:uncharacterized protein (DUF952 family)